MKFGKLLDHVLVHTETNEEALTLLEEDFAECELVGVSICSSCHWFGVWDHQTCPECGSEVDQK